MKKKNIYIFIPGFPGEANPRLPHEIRTVDIIAQNLLKKKLLFFPVQYPGIQNSESFSFQKTKLATFKIIEEKIAEGYQINLIGHSWGGLIAMLSAEAFPINKLILITPFVLEPSEGDILEMLEAYSKQFPGLIPAHWILTFRMEVDSLFKELQKITLKKELHCETEILINTEDTVVPYLPIKNYFQNFKQNNISITEIKNDHDFSMGKDDLEEWLNKILKKPVWWSFFK